MSKSWPRKCKTKFCRNVVQKSQHSSICRKCRWRKLKAADPVKYAYLKLKGRAGERGHDFTLTLEEYRKFAVETGYDKLKGKTKHSLSIHRKDDNRGYHADNIAAVTLSTNSKLQFSNLPPYLLEEMLAEERKCAENALAGEENPF